MKESVKAARKTRRIPYRGALFTLSVEDHPDYDGHLLVRLECDRPPRGLDRVLHEIVMRWPEAAT